jgi:TPR repeat protein
LPKKLEEVVTGNTLNANTKNPEWEKAVTAFRSGDLQGALFVFNKIAKRGSPAAYVEIGNIYEIGGEGVEQDLDESICWYNKSVDYMDEPMAHLALGRIYLSRNKSIEELEKARFHLQAAGDEPGALFGLGLVYDRGLGVVKDQKLAMEFYNRARNLGHAMAFKRVAELTIQSGRYIEGFCLWAKSAWLIFRILLKSPDDRRIKLA